MRRRDPHRIDRILEAAAEVFVAVGFAQAKLHQIADRARVAQGTVYLYAEDKEALFELVFLRSCESPSATLLDPPYRKAKPADRAGMIRGSVEAIAHFPQLWLAGQRRQIEQPGEEYSGILLEVAGWMVRYRNAILIAYRNRSYWPDLADVFDRLVWKDLHRRLSAYLGTRMRTGHLPAAGDPALAARLTLDALAGALIGNPVHPGPAEAPDLAATLVGLLTRL